jgi:hypothetical protein
MLPPNNRNLKGSGFTNINQVLRANQGSRLGQTISSGVQSNVQDVRAGVQSAQARFAEQEQKTKEQMEKDKQQQQQVLNRFENVQQPVTPQSGNQVSNQSYNQTSPQSGNQPPAPINPLQNYTADELREMKARREDYRKVLKNLEGTDYQKQIDDIKAQLVDPQERLAFLTQWVHGNKAGKGRKNLLYSVQNQVNELKNQILDPMRKLQMQREYQSYLDQFSDEDIDKRIQEYESGTAQRGSAESFIPQEELQNLTRLSNPFYTGPRGLEMDPGVSEKTQELMQLGRLSGSTGGRQELLRRFVGGNNYTTGQSNLDQVLLSSEGRNPLRDVRSQTRELGGEIQKNEAAAQARASQLSNLMQAQGEEFKKQLGSRREQMVGDLEKRLEAIKKGDISSLSQQKQIQDILVSQEQKYLTDPTLKTEDQRLTRGLDMARQQGILSDRDLKMLQGPGGLIERAKIAGFTPQQINQMVAERIKSNINPETATLGGVASNEELSKIAALDRLMGRQGTDVGIPGASDPYLSGRTRFDIDNFLNVIRQTENQNLPLSRGEFHAYNHNYYLYDPNQFNRFLEAQTNFLRSPYCFAPNTEILMQDGKYKKIKDIKPGEEVALGGEVRMIGQAESSDLYQYGSVEVTGDHAVFENGRWVRVKNSKKANPIGREGIIFTIHTDNHLVVTKGVVWADSMESEENEKNAEYSLEVLNQNKPRNRKLQRFVEEYFGKDPNQFEKIKTPF